MNNLARAGVLGLSTRQHSKSIFILCSGVGEFYAATNKDDLLHNYMAKIMKKTCLCGGR